MGNRRSSAVVVSSFALLALSACGKPSQDDHPPVQKVGSAVLTEAGLTASPGNVENEGTSISFSDSITSTDKISHVELFYGENDPATGLEFHQVICDDATSTPRACGNLSESCNGSHTFHDSNDTNGAAVGDHTVTCHVDALSSSSDFFLPGGMTVNEVPATVDAQSGPGANAYATQEQATFTPSGTFSDPSMDGSQLYESYTCTWSWGDGSADDTIANCDPNTNVSSVSHVYPDVPVGLASTSYTLTLTVQNDDADGGSPVSNTATVTVADRVPTIGPIAANPDPGVERAPMTFSAALSADPGEPVAGCAWDWGDGTSDVDPACGTTITTAGTASFAHTYADGDPTVYDVTLSVVDRDNGPTPDASRVQSFQVDNAAVVLAPLGSGSTLLEGATITFDASFSDSPDANWRADWDFNAPGVGAPAAPATTSQLYSAPGGVSAQASYADQGTFTVALSVTDQTDGSGNPGPASLTTSEMAQFTIADAQPQITNLSSNSPVTETNPITLQADIASGAGDAGGGLGGSDAIGSCDWDFGDGNSVTGIPVGDARCGGTAGSPNSAISHLYASGTYTATLTVHDEDSASSQTTSVTVSNVAPTVTIDTTPPSVNEGTGVAFTGSFTDPGGNADTYTCVFDFGDGTSAPAASGCAVGATVTSPSHAYADDASEVCGAATCTVTLTVTDEGGTGPTALSGSDSYGVAVLNVAPTISAVRTVSPVSEGQEVSVSVTASDAPGDQPVLRYSFDWDNDGCDPAQGDTCNGSLNGAAHIYADKGTWTIGVTVRDDDGGSVSQTVTVDVVDSKPAVVAITNTSPADRGQQVQAILQMSIQQGDNYTFTYDWGDGTPASTGCDRVCAHSYAADGTYPITVTIDDDDGNSTTATTTAEIAPLRPMPMSPIAGAEVTSTTPTLRTENTSEPGGGARTYFFEVYDNVQLAGAPVATSGAMVEGTASIAGATYTDFTPAAALSDNTAYWWRVHAEAGGVSGQNSDVEGFFVNTANDAPGAPSLSAPAVGAVEPTLHPRLEVGNAADVDRDALSYVFEYSTDSTFATAVTASAAIPEDPSGTTGWTIDVPLADNTTWYWRAHAVDEHGLAGADTASGSFFVNAANNPPAGIAISSPADGAVVTTATPDLVVSNATDLDGDPLTYDFEIDASPSFDAPMTGSMAEGAQSTTFTAPALSENTLYYWRARADDGITPGDWVTGSFFVNTVNDAPTAPIVQNPANGAELKAQNVALVVRNASDPEGDALTYTFTLYKDAALTQVQETSTAVTEGTNGETTFTPTITLGSGKTYYWTAVATDANGAASPASVTAVFETVGGGHHGGCDVGDASAGAGALPGLVLAAMLAAGGLLARRRRTAED